MGRRIWIGLVVAAGVAVVVALVVTLRDQHRCEAAGGTVQHHYRMMSKVIVDDWRCVMPEREGEPRR